MCFDALTIGGLLVAVVSGGFLVGLVSQNDRSSSKAPSIKQRSIQAEQPAAAVPQD
ncbi:MAG: hypothetical protein GVY22_00865 [Gammaproteobacteria bacterium]|jgi:hypothetical protein|nr:hypothetical protein [Gammaproteobacteria bacterium]